MNDDEKKVVIEDEDGKEYEVEVLFTYTNDERNTKYFFFYDPEDEDNVMVAKYFDDGHLEFVDDEEEFKEAEEVFYSYLDDLEIDEVSDEEDEKVLGINEDEK